MKYFLLIVIYYPALALSQLDGHYSDSGPFTHQFFDFHYDGSFKFGAGWCTGDIKGKGHYTIRDTLLTLRFEADKCDTDVQIMPVSVDIGDVVFFDVYVYDKKNESRPRKNVRYKLKNEDGEVVLQGRVDTTGHFNIKTLREGGQKILALSSLGPKKSIPLTCDKSYFIKANISGDAFSLTAEAGEEIIYNFVNTDDCDLFLKSMSKQYWGNYIGVYTMKED